MKGPEVSRAPRVEGFRARGVEDSRGSRGPEVEVSGAPRVERLKGPRGRRIQELRR